MTAGTMGGRGGGSGSGRGLLVAAAVGLLVLDVALFVLPLAAILALYVVLARPAWFRRAVERLYDGAD